VRMSFGSGLTANLTSVWHNILSRGSSRSIEVFFENAMVSLTEEFQGPLHIHTSDGTEARHCPAPQWVDDLPLGHDEVGLAVRAYVEADRDFISAVEQGTPPEPSLGEALTAHRLVDAAYRSAVGGGVPVSLG